MDKNNLQEIKEIVLNYVLDEYVTNEDVKISYDTSLISSGLVDSFSMVSLLVFLQNKFRIKIPPNKATPEAFDTVNKIADLVRDFSIIKDNTE